MHNSMYMCPYTHVCVRVRTRVCAYVDACEKCLYLHARLCYNVVACVCVYVCVSVCITK